MSEAAQGSLPVDPLARRSRGFLSRLSGTRLSVVIAALVFAATMHYAHETYLNPLWEYYGFTLRAPEFPELALAAVLVFVGAMLLPVAITRPSALIVLLLFVVVYVPAIVISLALDADRMQQYAPSLVALGFAFGAACLVARARMPHIPRPTAVPGVRFTTVVLLLWGFCCVVLLVVYGPIMRFAGLTDTYEQRAAGATANVFMGYTQSYFANVLSPTLLALGLLRRKRLAVLLGFAGCIIIYMITARRTVILLPVVIYALHVALKSRTTLFRHTAAIIAGITALVAAAATYYDDSAIALFMAVFLVFRTLALPGLTFSQYSDLFGSAGHTWWSHVKGLDLIIPPPAQFAADPLWPNLGYIVGARFYGNPDVDANANLFSGDGVAAAGALGVLVIGVVFACWLRILDKVCVGWDRRFALLVILPVAVVLTNGHFFTVLLSFGGLFWTLVFHMYKPPQRVP